MAHVPPEYMYLEGYEEDAHGLNDRWEVLGARYDSLWNELPEEPSKTIQKALSDWQDWYYGNWDAWGDSSRWVSALNAANSILDKAEAAGVQKSAPVDLPPQEVPIELPPLVITAEPPRPPPPLPVIPPPIEIDPIFYDPDADVLDYQIPEYEPVRYPRSTSGALPWVLGGAALLIAGLMGKK